MIRLGGIGFLRLLDSGYTPPFSATGSFPDWQEGGAPIGSIQLAGGTPPYAFNLASSAIPGVTFSIDGSNRLVASGVVPAAGPYYLEVELTDDDVGSYVHIQTVEVVEVVPQEYWTVGFSEVGDQRTVQPMKVYVPSLERVPYISTPMSHRSGNVAVAPPFSHFSTNYFNIAEHTDGSVFLMGDFFSANGMPANRTFKMNSNGRLDVNFPANFSSGRVRGMIQDEFENCYFFGEFSQIMGVSQPRISKMTTASLLLDSVFDASSLEGWTAKYPSGVSSILQAVYGDGHIVVDAQSPSGNVLPSALDSVTGVVNTAWFDYDIDGYHSRTEILPNKAYIMIGNWTNIDATSCPKIARFTDAGILDTGFVSPVTAGRPERLLVVDDSTIFIGGNMALNGDATTKRIARLDAVSGVVDTSFTVTYVGDLYSMQMLHTDRLLINGLFTSVNGVATTRNMAAVSPVDGSIDPGFVFNGTAITNSEFGQTAFVPALYTEVVEDFDAATRRELRLAHAWSAEFWGDLLVRCRAPRTITTASGSYQTGPDGVADHARLLSANHTSATQYGYNCYHADQPFTVCVHLKPNATSLSNVVQVSLGTAGVDEVFAFVYDDTTGWTARLKSGTVTLTESSPTSKADFSFVLIRNNGDGTVEFYVNGSWVDSDSISGSLLTSWTTTTFGGGATISGFKYFHAALSNAAVSYLYRSGIGRHAADYDSELLADSTVEYAQSFLGSDDGLWTLEDSSLNNSISGGLASLTHQVGTYSTTPATPIGIPASMPAYNSASASGNTIAGPNVNFTSGDLSHAMFIWKRATTNSANRTMAKLGSAAGNLNNGRVIKHTSGTTGILEANMYNAAGSTLGAVVTALTMTANQWHFTGSQYFAAQNLHALYYNGLMIGAAYLSAPPTAADLTGSTVARGSTGFIGALSHYVVRKGATLTGPQIAGLFDRGATA